MKRSPLHRRTPLRRSRRPGHTTAQNDAKQAREIAQDLVAARCGGRCEICGTAPADDWHHRKNRSQGGEWSASNGLALCRADHEWVTRYRTASYGPGWAVPRHGDPATTPVLRRGVMVLLSDDGSVKKVTAANW